MKIPSNHNKAELIASRRRIESALNERCGDDHLRILKPVLPRLAYFDRMESELDEHDLARHIHQTIDESCPPDAAGDLTREEVAHREDAAEIAVRTVLDMQRSRHARR